VAVPGAATTFLPFSVFMPMKAITDTKSIKYREPETRFRLTYFPLFPNNLFCSPLHLLLLLNKLVPALLSASPFYGQITGRNLNRVQEPSSYFLLFIKFLCCGVGYFALVQYFHPW